ncbi:hypothetical protein Aca07nite_81860 [Actinoplanes capillaceus]|uniref:Uncharacterized protein n=1 Tax=Actinoplanes campanulatus TaxID=113559 RepID=A0ABQ3WX92_9ACTN|nr:hypothetical protein Aca07nite_81860 [Actinoplanes capillaceus]
MINPVRFPTSGAPGTKTPAREALGAGAWRKVETPVGCDPNRVTPHRAVPYYYGPYATRRRTT